MRRFAKLMMTVILGAALVAAGCVPQQATQPGPAPALGPQVLSINWGEEPPSLDSSKSTDTLSFDILGAIQEGLTRYNPQGRQEKGSGVASDWSVTPDGLRWTFKIRPDARWSDGKPVTAHDFVYAWKRALDPRTASEYAYQLYYLKGGEAANGVEIPKDYDEKADVKAATDKKIDEALAAVGVRAVDDATLEVTLEAPTAYFLSLTAFPTLFPLRQDIVEKHGDKYAADPDKMVFNGPFMLTEWKHEASLTLKKNPTYWDARTVRLETITGRMVKDHNTYINMFEAGEIDYSSVPADFYNAYKAKGLKTFADAVTWYLELNHRDPLLKNLKARQALNYAIDRTAFAEAIGAGFQPALTYTPPSLPGMNKSFAEEVGPQLPATADAAKAKQFWSDALRETGISNPVVKLLAGDSSLHKKRAQIVQEMITKALGVQVEVESVALSVRLDRSTKGQYMVHFAGWGADYLDPMTFMDMWVTGGGHNNTAYSSKQYDDLIKIGKTSPDQAARMKAMADAEKLLAAELPIVPMYHPATHYVFKPYVKGFLYWPTAPSTEWKWVYIEGKK